MEVASRFVHTSSSSSSPSIGGMSGSDPVAMISLSVSSSFPSISTSPDSLMRASPRRSSAPLSVSFPAWWVSSQSETWKSRQASASLTLIGPEIASRAPGACLASERTSPGRSSVFEGMQAQ